MELLGGSLRHHSDHPVYNFLFEVSGVLSSFPLKSRQSRLTPALNTIIDHLTHQQYYHFKPQSLLDYSPGIESPSALLLPSPTATAAATADGGDEAPLDALRLLAGKAVLVSGVGVEVAAGKKAPPAVMWLPSPLGTKGWTEKHVTSLRLGHEVLRASVDRPPIFYCYGGACEFDSGGESINCAPLCCLDRNRRIRIHTYKAHEWAMLYHPTGSTDPPPHKYQRLPLRISQQTLNDFVEARPIRCGGERYLIPVYTQPPFLFSRIWTHVDRINRCTHYDAFRFFTPAARPLNVYGADLAKRRPGQIQHEQPGCLHAGMGAWRSHVDLKRLVTASASHHLLLTVADRFTQPHTRPHTTDLFKWALKLGPYAPSDLVVEALRLAVQCRVLDMRASPYDLRGLDPSIDFGTCAWRKGGWSVDRDFMYR